MATNYTNLLGFALPTTGELSGTWGDVVNNSITELVEDSIAGTATASVTSGDWTLSTTGSGAANEARCAILIPTGSPGTTRNIIAPSSSKAYVVENQSNGAIVIKGAATVGVTIAAGDKALVAWNGSDFVRVGSSGTVTSVGGTGNVNGITLSGTVTSSGNLTLGGTLSGVNLGTQVTGTLPVANGGTGGTSQATARTGLGATTIGSNVFTLTNPSAVTFPRFNADNTVSALDAATFRSAIGAGTSSTTGTVTSVSGTGTASGLSLSGTVTTSGSLTLSGTVNSLAAGTYGISISGNAATASNGGVTSISAGSGISVNQSTGAVTITNTGGSPAVLLYQSSGNATAVGINGYISSTYNYYILVYNIRNVSGAPNANLRYYINNSLITGEEYQYTGWQANIASTITAINATSFSLPLAQNDDIQSGTIHIWAGYNSSPGPQHVVKVDSVASRTNTTLSRFVTTFNNNNVTTGALTGLYLFGSSTANYSVQLYGFKTT